jgi:hypothetical protein
MRVDIVPLRCLLSLLFHVRLFVIHRPDHSRRSCDRVIANPLAYFSILAARSLPQTRQRPRPPTATNGLPATRNCYLPRWRNRPHHTNGFGLRRPYVVGGMLPMNATFHTSFCQSLQRHRCTCDTMLARKPASLHRFPITTLLLASVA